MTFAMLTPGSSVFLDTNTLVYYFQPHLVYGSACAQLVQAIEHQQLVGITSTHVLGEMAHRLMTLEASALAGWSSSKVSQRLKQNPTAIHGLTRFQAAVDTILQSRIQVLTISPSLLSTAAGLSRQLGSLTNDALIVALMQQHGLTNIASVDRDFDRVPGIKRYAPV
jgi:predicted nucleic acid-binding protein